MKGRTLEVLKFFVTANYTASSNFLEGKFHIGSRTLRNEIREINDYLSSKDLNEIQTIRKSGYLLHMPLEEMQILERLIELEEKHYYLDRDSRLFDLILSFSLDDDGILLYQKEAEYEISKSTLDEDMRRVRNDLYDYGIEIVSTPKQGMLLNGSEQSIRMMIYDVISQHINVMDLLPHAQTSIKTSILNKHLPIDRLEKIAEIHDQSIVNSGEEVYRNQTIIFTAIWLMRYQRQANLLSYSCKSFNTPNTINSQFIMAVCNFFYINPPETEIKYICFILDTFNSRDMNNSIEWVQAQLLSLQLINFVEKETKIPFSKKEANLNEGLYQHIVGLINRMKSDVQIVNPLKENIKKYYGNIYNSIKNFQPEIESKIGKTITEDELAFLTIHFSTTASAINQDTAFTYKVIVICNHGLIAGRLLSENLKELFNVEVVAVLNSRELELIDKLDVDLIFSTVGINYLKKPTLILEPLIRGDSQDKIKLFLEENSQFKRTVTHNNNRDLFDSVVKIVENRLGKVPSVMYTELEALFDKRYLVDYEKEVHPMLKDILKDEHILLNETAGSWEEAIKKVSQPLLMSKAIEARYVSAMIESVKEYGPYIVIGKHLALAHARPEDGVHKLGVSVMTLHEPISFGHEENDPVKIIFCLSAINAYSHLNIMRNLIELINDEERIDRLCKEENIEIFKEILFSDVQ